MQVPKFYELMTPVLRAMDTLGGYAHIDQLTHEVANILSPTERTRFCLFKPGRTRKTRLECLTRYACKYLCCYGVLECHFEHEWKTTDMYEVGMTVSPRDIIHEALNRVED